MNVQSLKRIAVLAYLTLLVSCGGGGGSAFFPLTNNDTGNTGAAGTDLPPFIKADFISFMSGAYPGYAPNASVVVQDPSTHAPIASAIVTINNIVLSYNADHEAYEGNMAAAPGDAVTLSVTVSEKTYTASAAQFTSAPTISVPVAGIWHASIPNPIMWSGGTPTANAVYNIGIVDAHDPSGALLWPSDTDNYMLRLNLNNTFYGISPNQVTPGDRLLIAGIVRKELIPGAAYDSQLVVGGCSAVPLTVVDSTLTSITVSPAHASLPKGTKQQFTATGTFSDNSTQDVTGLVSWSSVGGVGMSFLTPGLGSAGGSLGDATITASLNGISGSTSVTVLPPSLLSIQLTPASRTIAPGTIQHFTALGLYTDGHGLDLASTAAWSSTDPNVATVANGQAAAVSQGTTTISASLDGITKSASLTVGYPLSISGNYVNLQSDTGDYIGKGETFSFNQGNATLTASATGGLLEFRVSSYLGWWSGHFAVPSTLSQLQTGTYDNVTPYPSSYSAVGSMDFSGDGRGCNMLTGWFAIDNVTYNNGSLAGIDLRFAQHCEGLSPALYGWIHWAQ